MGSLELVRPELPFATTCSIRDLAPPAVTLGWAFEKVIGAHRYNAMKAQHSEPTRAQARWGRKPARTLELHDRFFAPTMRALGAACRSSCDRVCIGSTR